MTAADRFFEASTGIVDLLLAKYKRQESLLSSLPFCVRECTALWRDPGGSLCSLHLINIHEYLWVLCDMTRHSLPNAMHNYNVWNFVIENETAFPFLSLSILLTSMFHRYANSLTTNYIRKWITVFIWNLFELIPVSDFLHSAASLNKAMDGDRTSLERHRVLYAVYPRFV